MRSPCPALLALVLSAPLVTAAARTVTVTVEAGEYERRESIVRFPLAGELGEFEEARLGDGTYALQMDGTNAVFRVGLLPKGTVTNFVLVPRSAARAGLAKLILGDGLAAERRAAQLDFRHVQLPMSGPQFTNQLFAYQAEPGAFPREGIKEFYRRGGYLQSLHTAKGRAIVTDDFPPNHIHHHGIWWAWTKTEFDGRKPDFWNMGDGKGRVDFVALDSQWSGVVQAGFSARHRFLDLTGPKPVAALDETWHVTAYTPHGWQEHWLLDLVSAQRCATTNALKLPPYHYGGLGLRGNWAWNGKDNLRILTADGETDRVRANTQKARWCDLWGRIDGADCGIAVLCHPSNFRAPQPMRVHPTEPFFCYAPQQGGDMEIKPGDTYISRYRFVIHDGPPDRAELDRLWNDYAHPPVVKVTVGE
jgi:hypothetical protein